jgi:hypothetical protein
LDLTLGSFNVEGQQEFNYDAALHTSATERATSFT